MIFSLILVYNHMTHTFEFISITGYAEVFIQFQRILKSLGASSCSAWCLLWMIDVFMWDDVHSWTCGALETLVQYRGCTLAELENFQHKIQCNIPYGLTPCWHNHNGGRDRTTQFSIVSALPEWLKPLDTT